MPDDTGIVRCSKCGMTIGNYIECDKRVFLRVGPVDLSSAHGNCVYCGAPFHWVASEKQLAELVARTIELRKGECK